MQNGQNDNFENKSIFSFTPTGDGSNLENTIAINRDFGSVGSAVVSSLSSNREIEGTTEFQQPAEANNINGELLAKPESIQSPPELVSAPIVDPNSVQLGELIEMNASNQESSTTLANFVEIDKDGEISKKTINTVIEETRKYERPGSSIHPADIVDMKDQATEDYQTAREESSRIKKETT